MLPYVVLDKKVGETPLSCAEAWRSQNGVATDIPLAYAGRLDPMASGKLLVLIGDECKVQERYHGLDKAYDISVLLDIISDSGDVLGVVAEANTPIAHNPNWATITDSFVGEITLPYPTYSARTVHGKPLHVWASEGRLAEITIPSKTSRIYSLVNTGERLLTRTELYCEATAKVALLPTVTDPRKALGNDFRRPLVYQAWEKLSTHGRPDDIFTIVHFTCIASSGTYMRTLADELARKIGTRGLAFSIHRTHIGEFTDSEWVTEYK